MPKKKTDAKQAEFSEQVALFAAPRPAAFDPVIIEGSMFGEDIYFAPDGTEPMAGMVTFYASELEHLRNKTKAQLLKVFLVKKTFGGGLVRK